MFCCGVLWARGIDFLLDPCWLFALFDSDSLRILLKKSQRWILLNSLLNNGFIPAYMKGLMVLDKLKEKEVNSWALRGILSPKKRVKTAMTQAGIQHNMNANTMTNNDLLIRISCGLPLAIRLWLWWTIAKLMLFLDLSGNFSVAENCHRQRKEEKQANNDQIMNYFSRCTQMSGEAPGISRHKVWAL